MAFKMFRFALRYRDDMKCLVAVLCILVCTGSCEAQFLGSFYAVGPKGVSQRATLDLQFLNSAEYQFINMFQTGSGNPSLNGFSAGAVTSNILDANGWPCTNQVNASCPNSASTNPVGPATGKTMAFAAAVPANTTASPNYTGSYCMQGLGSGKFQLQGPQGGTWTILTAGSTTCAGFNGSANNCTSSNVTISSVSTITDDTWSGWCVALSYSGPRQTSDQGVMVTFSSDDLNSNGHYLKNIALYQQPDGSDFASGCPGLTPSGGCMFRRAYKQQLVTNDYSYIRFLNWTNWGIGGRFEDRPTAVNDQYPGGSRVAGLLPYAAATNTGNAYTIAGVTGTPASMKHGEQATWTPTASGNQGATGINSIAIAGTTVTMTVGSTTSFSNGDTLISYGDSIGVLGNLYYFPVTVTIDSSSQLHFTMSNAASLTPCASSCGTIGEYATLQVGSGNDRTAYPLYDSNGHNPLAADGFSLNQSNRVCFSKTLGGTTNGSGVWNHGAWWACGGDVVPLEFITEFINELNAMSPTRPIGLWIPLPAVGIICSVYYSDPDCSSGSDYPLNTVKTILNGANGYAGLCLQCKIIAEHANETWDGSGTASLLAWFSVLPATSGFIGCGQTSTNFATPSTLYSELAMQDIQATYPLGGSRVKYTLGLQGGFTGGAGGTVRITGSGLFFGSCAPAAPTGASAPITLYDYANMAPYVDGNCAFTSFPCTETHLVTYEAQWASDVNAFGFNSSQALADEQLWVNWVVNGSGNGDSMAFYEGNTQTYEAAAAPYGKYIVNYEGGFQDNWSSGLITAISCTSGTVTITAAAVNFQSQMVINHVSVAGYNGVWTATGTGGSFTYSVGASCPVGTPTTNYQGYYGYVAPISYGFIEATKNSTAWATAVTGFLNFMAGEPNTGLPNMDYIQVGPQWGVTYPDTFGATNTEGGGNNSAWSAVGTFNNAQTNFLLKRDLTPTSNDNTPVGINRAA